MYIIIMNHCPSVLKWGGVGAQGCVDVCVSCPVPSEIFSPESAGSRKTSRARPEMSTHGMSRLRP